MAYGVIYLITNKVNGKSYVGKTKQPLKQRFKQHSRTDSLIGKVIRKYGAENFSVEVLEECATPEQLNEREKFFIAALNCKVPHGYNRTDGGDGVAGYTPTPQHRANISAALSGRHLSPEYCKNISISKSGENHPNYGKHRSAQTKAKLRIARLGEKNPQYGKPAPNRGKKHTEATKAKMRGKRHCNFGKPSSRRGKSLFPNLISEMDVRGIIYPAMAKLLDMSLTAFSMKMRGERNFTDKNKEKSAEFFGKPIEYLFAYNSGD